MTHVPITKYGTREDYRQREDLTPFDDRSFADEWQNEVYDYAYQEFRTRDLRTVVDFGCGSGYKLTKYFPPHATIGVEIEPALSFLMSKYPARIWRSGVNIAESIRGADMVICSDVIEHLPDPCGLLQTFAMSGAEVFVISTPALEMMVEQGWSPRLGPPGNASHIREWTTAEFAALVSRYLKIVEHRITNVAQCTQMIAAIKS